MTNEYSVDDNLERFLFESDQSYLERQAAMSFSVPSDLFDSPDKPLVLGVDYTSLDGVKYFYNIFVNEVGASDQKKREVRHLHHVLRQRSPYRGTVYSGGTMHRSYFEDFYKVGKSRIIGYPFSTSVQRETAENFIKNRGTSETHVKVLHIVESRTGVRIDDISKFSTEQEVLFGYDTSFEIRKIERQPSDQYGYERFHVYMSERHSPLIGRINGRILQFDPKIDLQRYFEKSDWEKVTDRLPIEAIMRDPSVEAWVETNKWLFERRHELSLSVPLLKQIHKNALKNNYFYGFERRRIREAFVSGRISKDEALRYLRLNQERVSFTGRSHAALAGEFRSHDMDIIVDRGAKGEPKNRLDLLNASLKPFFEIDAASVHEVGQDRFIADIYSPPSRQVESLVAETIKRAKSALAQASSVDDYVRVVLQLQEALISIHPFLDGNGRAIRLLTDLLLVQRGLAPMARPLENDFYLSSGEAEREARALMTEYYYQKSRARGASVLPEGALF